MGTCWWAHLEDDAVIDVIAQAFEKRSPQSRRRGRLETPADVVIRMLILSTSLIGATTTWNNVRANLVYGAFMPSMPVTCPTRRRS
jgi:hypothetical protein